MSTGNRSGLWTPGQELHRVRVVRVVRWHPPGIAHTRHVTRQWNTRSWATWMHPNGERMSIAAIQAALAVIADAWKVEVEAFIAGRNGDCTARDIRVAFPPPKRRGTLVQPPSAPPAVGPVNLQRSSTLQRTRVRVVQDRLAGATANRLDHPSIKGSPRAR